MHHHPPHLELPEAVYLPDGDGRYSSTSLSAGPWDADGQHAGASAALLAHCMQHHEVAAGVTPFLARLTVDLLRPAPVAPLDVSVRTVRAGRRAHWLAGVLRAGDREVARATALRVVGEPVPLPEGAIPTENPPPPPETCEPQDGSESPWLMFWHGFDFRPFRGERGVPGPGGVWFNLEAPLVAGTENTPLMRAVSAADYALGIGGVLDFDAYAFPNADLTVHLHRSPVGPWVALDAVTWVDPDGGTALAEGSLWDTQGRVGRAVQSLVLSRRPR